ncbi:MYXO-CTERM sorting domain-containing protein [Nannocystis sp. SCPEA4]|uniref:MYXO-CTERM sorting domain-containing protein n=1 Tax=Nannocystis sp. SCPEA4 TaxID=2996787 RepID=UPI002270F1F6|nr:MYXO-CTERM sorting domain-containing protein [Nannocystis sp. SCPEA4]MCY1063099.1 hypothetical protein [Nannocystis sp. SCPEA4]
MPRLRPAIPVTPTLHTSGAAPHDASPWRSLALAFAAAALAPSEADACGAYYPCEGVTGWSDLSPRALTIPTDGVLLLQGANLGGPDDELPDIELTVTRDGQPVAGAVELTDIDGVLLWRPTAPLEPSANYQVVGALDNELPDNECTPGVIPLEFEFQTEAGPSAPLQLPQMKVTESVTVLSDLSVESLVCCDGAMPKSVEECGMPSVLWGGFCDYLRAIGYLHVTLTLTTGLPKSTDAMIQRTLIVDGERTLSTQWESLGEIRTEPFCAAFEVRNLATGETLLSPETYYGQAMAATIGLHALDPSATLAERCESTPYVCELDESSSWDPNRCTTWPDGAPTTESAPPTDGEPGDASGDATGDATGDTDSGGQDGLVRPGCACDSRSPATPAALGLLALALLRRRRR